MLQVTEVMARYATGATSLNISGSTTPDTSRSTTSVNTARNIVMHLL